VVTDRWYYLLPQRIPRQHPPGPGDRRHRRGTREIPGAGNAALAPAAGRSVIPKSTKPHRIAENFDVFDFDLADDELAAIDGLNTTQRGGPEPTDISLESSGRPIPEA